MQSDKEFHDFDLGLDLDLSTVSPHQIWGQSATLCTIYEHRSRTLEAAFFNDGRHCFL